MPHCPHLGRENPEEGSLLSPRGPQWDRVHHAARRGHLPGPRLLASLSHFPLVLGSSRKETPRTRRLSQALLLEEHGLVPPYCLSSRPPGPTGPRPRQVWIWTFYEGGLRKTQRSRYIARLRLYERSRIRRSTDTESRRRFPGLGEG